MRIFAPFTKITDATLSALAPYLNETVFVDVSANQWRYLDYFQARWDEGETFISVEHDIIPWPGAIESLWECEHDWCVFDTQRPGENSAVQMPLSLVKFSADFIRQVPDVWRQRRDTHETWRLTHERITPPLAWNCLDCFLHEHATEQRGLTAHQHWPSVTHFKPIQLDQAQGIVRSKPYGELDYEFCQMTRVVKA